MCDRNRFFVTITNPLEVIEYAKKVLGYPPSIPFDKLSKIRIPWTFWRIMHLFLPSENNWLARLGQQTTFGTYAVLGNDCYPEDKRAFEVNHVSNIHFNPKEANGWQFVGIEGSIVHKNGSGILLNNIGYIKHSDEKVGNRLNKIMDRSKVSPESTVIVSYTPPHGCLDLAIRFGLEKIGSPSLTKVIDKKQPALVICGHCHSQGGKVPTIGNTMIVNVASDDRSITKSRAAIIDLYPDKKPNVTWIDPKPHSVLFMHDIGLMKFEKLSEIGITRPIDLFQANDEVFKLISFGSKRKSRLKAFERALKEQRHVWISNNLIKLLERLLFYDVETGLAGERQEPWLIALLEEGSNEVIQFMALDEDKRSRNKMYKDLNEYIKSKPNSILCSWSGHGFDKRVVATGISIWYPKIAKWWSDLPEIDLLNVMKSHLVFPCYDWSVKTISDLLGFQRNKYGSQDIDGFEVGLSYELYKQYGTPMNLDVIKKYNADDVKMLDFITSWIREQNDYPEVNQDLFEEKHAKH